MAKQKQPNKRRSQPRDYDEAARVWNDSANLTEAASRLGCANRNVASGIGSKLRLKGYSIKKFTHDQKLAPQKTPNYIPDQKEIWDHAHRLLRDRKNGIDGHLPQVFRSGYELDEQDEQDRLP